MAGECIDMVNEHDSSVSTALHAKSSSALAA